MNSIEKLTISAINILRHIIFTSITLMSVSLVFELEYKNKLAFVYMSILVGLINYLMTNLLILKNQAEKLDEEMIVMAKFISLEKAIRHLQVLCTDEDVLERAEKETIAELKEMKNEYIESKSRG